MEYCTTRSEAKGQNVFFQVCTIGTRYIMDGYVPDIISLQVIHGVVYHISSIPLPCVLVLLGTYEYYFVFCHRDAFWSLLCGHGLGFGGGNIGHSRQYHNRNELM